MENTKMSLCFYHTVSAFQSEKLLFPNLNSKQNVDIKIDELYLYTDIYNIYERNAISMKGMKEQDTPGDAVAGQCMWSSQNYQTGAKSCNLAWTNTKMNSQFSSLCKAA